MVQQQNSLFDPCHYGSTTPNWHAESGMEAANAHRVQRRCSSSSSSSDDSGHDSSCRSSYSIASESRANVGLPSAAATQAAFAWGCFANLTGQGSTGKSQVLPDVSPADSQDSVQWNVDPRAFRFPTTSPRLDVFGTPTVSGTNITHAQPAQLSPIEMRPQQQHFPPTATGGFLPSMETGQGQEPLLGHPIYVKLRDLNWGTSGFVQLARNTETRERVAIKFIRRGREQVDVNMQEISRELLNQRMCAHHPNIVQLREVFLTTDYLAVAMEFANGGDLSEYVDSQFSKGADYMPEDDARWVFQQLIVAVDYCHRLGIANRDIKLDNMLLHGSWPKPLLKLCDFGFSKNEIVQSVSKSTCGTPEYMAPEVLFGSKYNGQDADVWSCGVSLYVLLTGVFPFSRPTDEEDSRPGGGEGNTKQMREMFRRIIAGSYWPIPELSMEAQHLIHHIFRPNPAERCTTEDIMAHPWFTRNLDPSLATLNNRLMAAKQAEHRACQQSIKELEDRTRRHFPQQISTLHDHRSNPRTQFQLPQQQLQCSAVSMPQISTLLGRHQRQKQQQQQKQQLQHQQLQQPQQQQQQQKQQRHEQREQQREQQRQQQRQQQLHMQAEQLREEQHIEQLLEEQHVQEQHIQERQLELLQLQQRQNDSPEIQALFHQQMQHQHSIRHSQEVSASQIRESLAVQGHYAAAHGTPQSQHVVPPPPTRQSTPPPRQQSPLPQPRQRVPSPRLPRPPSQYEALLSFLPRQRAPSPRRTTPPLRQSTPPLRQSTPPLQRVAPPSRYGTPQLRAPSGAQPAAFAQPQRAASQSTSDKSDMFGAQLRPSHSPVLSRPRTPIGPLEDAMYNRYEAAKQRR